SPSHVSGRAVRIEVCEPAAFAQPEKRAVLQPYGITVLIHPRGRRFPKEATRVSIRCVGQPEIQPGLFTVLYLVNDLLRVRSPPNIDDQELGGRVFAQADPGCPTAIDACDPDFCERIGIAGLR